MADYHFTHHLIALHPNEARILLLQGKDWQLPAFQPEKDLPSAISTRVYLEQSFALDAIMLRMVQQWEIADHIETLFLLEAQNAPPLPEHAHWLSLAELEHLQLADERFLETINTILKEDSGQLAIPMQRPTWSERGWLERITNWLEGSLEPLGFTLQGKPYSVKHWAFSVICCCETNHGKLFFKAVPPLFARELAVSQELARLAPDQLPQIIIQRPGDNWFLTRDFGEKHPETLEEQAHALSTFAELQIKLLNHLHVLEQAGCEKRSIDNLHERLELLLRHPSITEKLSSSELNSLKDLKPALHTLIGNLSSCDIPETLVHADFHFGNVAMQGNHFIYFDWTDACLSHPFFDLTHVRFTEEENVRTAYDKAYLEPWREAFPERDLDRALSVASILAHIFYADSYMRILDMTEPASRWRFGNVPAWHLRHLLDESLLQQIAQLSHKQSNLNTDKK